MQPPELIIGLGASAGGLRALETFFEAMPCDSGCALVVVQHLSPDFKSLMNDLLARHTRMRIFRVENGMQLERDCIYLIPPKKLMTIKGGKLVLTEREAARQLEFPINVFLDSLAADAGPTAVAVILSGTGTDGTQGVRSVHEAGGLVIAQSLESADFNGMPRSAINTEMVDYILPPEQMPEAITTYARYPHLRLAQNARPLTLHEAKNSYGVVLEQLRHTYGIDFGEYKIPTVQRRILRRMSFLQIADVPSYAKRLSEQPTELDDLYKDLLIGVTEFVRDPEAFEVLGTEVLPNLLKESGREEFRVWVAGCASGEEAYSIGILVDEQVRAAGYKGRVVIFATDMHRDSLARAAAGVYERARLENLGPSRIARYFKEEANGLYRVIPDLRQRIVFSSHNVINDPPFTKVDLITCRNMLIYFQPATQERVLALFHFALRHGGVLFLGSSEGLGNIEGGFATLSVKNKIYRKSTDSLVPPPEIRTLPSLRPLRVGGGALGSNLPSTVAVSRALLNAYDFLLRSALPSSFLATENGEIVQYFEHSSRFLLPPEGRSHDNLFNRTDGDLRLALTTLIPKAFKLGEPVQARGVRQSGGAQDVMLDISVTPIPDERYGCSLVHVALTNPREAPRRPSVTTDRAGNGTFESKDALHHRVNDLELELHSTKENLQSTVEELQTSNEELQATNEELLAANEELQSTNEELHSVNEELYTVNAEFERKNHELKTIGEDLNNLLASTDIGTLFLDRHLRIRRFTPSIGRIFKLLPQDISRPIDHLAYQLEGEPDLIARLKEVLATGKPAEREICTRDGEWLYQRVLPFRTAEDQIDGVVLTFTDISGLKSIQDKLNLAMEFSRMVWWEWNLVSQELTTHTGGQSLFGFEGSVFKTTTAEWHNLIHPEDLERVQQSLERCLNGDASRWECQHRFLTRDGQWRWVVNKGKVAASNETGQPVRMLGTTQDVHERCLAEQEIRKLNLALERGPVMVMITDLESRIEYVNQAFCEVTGYSAAEVIGQTPRLLRSEEEPESTFAEMWACLKSGETWQGEIVNRRKDGTPYRERATIAPLRDADGKATYYVALKEAIQPEVSSDTKVQRNEEQLAQIQKMETLGALAGGIAHDFNNILTAIIGHNELAAERTTAEHPAYESLLQVRQASRRASDLVRRILSFSRRGPSVRETLNLGEMVSEIIPLLRASIPSSVKVEVSIARNDLAVVANRTDIQQVVLNLGGNAAYAMREKGGILKIGLERHVQERPRKVTSGTLAAGTYLLLKVCDTGHGIPHDVLLRIFEPFFTTKPAGEGTGLGLPIVLGIVLAHGGAVSVSTREGQGTQFDVFLPAVANEPKVEPVLETPKVSGTGQSIAFVDDEQAITMIAKVGLSRHGFAPTTFSGAKELIDHLEGGGAGFDLIITDQTMPGMTGLEMIRHLRANGVQTPIIILSGNARYVSKEDLAGLPRVQFIPKPFDLRELAAHIAKELA